MEFQLMKTFKMNILFFLLLLAVQSQAASVANQGPFVYAQMSFDMMMNPGEMTNSGETMDSTVANADGQTDEQTNSEADSAVANADGQTDEQTNSEADSAVANADGQTDEQTNPETDSTGKSDEQTNPETDSTLANVVGQTDEQINTETDSTLANVVGQTDEQTNTETVPCPERFQRISLGCVHFSEGIMEPHAGTEYCHAQNGSEFYSATSYEDLTQMITELNSMEGAAGFPWVNLWYDEGNWVWRGTNFTQDDLTETYWVTGFPIAGQRCAYFSAPADMKLTTYWSCTDEDKVTCLLRDTTK